jgi:hypothetical protein
MQTKLIKTPLRNDTIGRAMWAWEDNTKMRIRELRCEDARRTEPAQDRVEWPFSY